MPYTVPQFNLLCDMWFAGKNPANDLPDVSDVPCQFYLYSRVSFDVQPCELELYTPPIFLRLPVAENANWIDCQIAEVPAESGRYYRARFKEKMHLGFPNEYRMIVIVQCNSEGVPLIRDIEFAEPCLPPAPAVGAGEMTFNVGIETTGEGEDSGGGGPPVGEGSMFVFEQITTSGSGTQS